MKNEMCKLEEYPSGVLFRSAVLNLVKKIAKKQEFRLLVSAIAVEVSFLVIYKFTFWYCGWTMLHTFVNVPFVVMFTAGVGGFVSNMGSFSAKRYVLGAAVSGLALYVFIPFYDVFEAMDFSYPWSRFWEGVGLELLWIIPLFVVSLFIDILPLMICAHINKKA